MRKVIFFLFFPVIFAACQERPDYPKRTPPEGFLQEPGNQAVGKALFLQKCAWCHGSLEEGSNPRISDIYPHIATFRDPKYASMDPAYLYWRIDQGKQVEPYRSRGSIMPAWGPHFSEETIWQLVAYLRARPTATAKELQRDSR